jgi:hypothetical protein
MQRTGNLKERASSGAGGMLLQHVSKYTHTTVAALPPCFE